MKKITKLLAFCVSLAMVVSIFFGTGVQMQAASSSQSVYFHHLGIHQADVNTNVWGSAQTTKSIYEETADENSGTITFYFDNSKTNWSNVYVYAWGGSETNTFRGYAVAIGSNVYRFTLAASYQNILFKNTEGISNWDQQTADVGEPKNGGIFTPYSSANKTGGSWSAYVPVSPVTYTTVKYDNSKTNWSNVYAYVWVKGDSSVAPAVLSRTEVSGTTYSFQVASTYEYILFKNTEGTDSWDQQTADATIPDSDGYTFIPYGSANKTEGYWKENQTSSTKRRALVLGETSTYAVPILDVTSMVRMFENFTFDGKAMDEIVQYNDHTIAEITAKMQTVFADTTDQDISYIYMTCHGGTSGEIYIGSQQTYYTGEQLRVLLDQYVKGQIVLMIDCCYAGSIIDQDITSTLAEDTDFADAFLASFIAPDMYNGGELSAERFHVICSSNKTESSAGGTTSLATKYWEEGCGWSEVLSQKTTLHADVNQDDKVTMKELYEYSYPLVLEQNPKQHVVVYPENDNLIMGGRF